ncbi:hypothetical protein SDC9_46701 [bioreactor metagenome]|uniref:Transposase InsH N-terminal domain-containing protein n=1 Tax=bioreactor metagenome TaxID=1076179 RepID=A0A644W9G8_9ZZZZ
MLQMYLLQIWFSLSDEGVEDAIYDSYAMRKFMSIDFMKEQVPDATTLLHFRRLIEENGLGKAFFDAINHCLEQCGHMMKGGTGNEMSHGQTYMMWRKRQNSSSRTTRSMATTVILELIIGLILLKMRTSQGLIAALINDTKKLGA